APIPSATNSASPRSLLATDVVIAPIARSQRAWQATAKSGFGSETIGRAKPGAAPLATPRQCRGMCFAHFADMQNLNLTKRQQQALRAQRTYLRAVQRACNWARNRVKAHLLVDSFGLSRFRE